MVKYGFNYEKPFIGLAAIMNEHCYSLKSWTVCPSSNAFENESTVFKEASNDTIIHQKMKLCSP